MSETLTMSLNDAKKWLENQTSAMFNPVHSKAEKLTKEMGKTLESLLDTSKMLLENSEKEIERKNAKTYKRARALNKLTRLFVERLRGINIPNQISYTTLSVFAQETQQVFITIEVDVRNWFPRISPFFIMDRRKFVAIFERAKESLKELGNFLTKEYVKTKKLEETFQHMDTIKTLEIQLRALEEEKTQVDNEKVSLEREISEVKQKIIQLESKSGISQLNQINIEIEALTTEVKRSLQYLQKPFLKLQALSSHGGGSGLTLDEVRKLNQYLENPFDAIATENVGYPLLRQILQNTAKLMVEDKLKLKPDKTRKAEQAISNILNQNSLESLHKKCVNVLSQKHQLSNSPEFIDAKTALSKLNENLEMLERKWAGAESRKATIERNYAEMQNKIRILKKQVEDEIFAFLNKTISIQ